MTWNYLADFIVSNEWQFTPVVTNTYFKITHTIGNYNLRNLLGIIALVNDENTILEIYEPTRILPRPEAEIVKFSKIYNWNYKLGIKRINLSASNPIDWQVQIDINQAIETAIDLQFTFVSLHAKFNDPKKLLFLICI
jgi:hypothetical protein